MVNHIVMWKFKPEIEESQKEALKKQRENNKEMKEYQLSVTIDVHDFETRRKNAAGYLRRELGSRLSLRKVPELRFIADDSIEKSAHISRIIDSFEGTQDGGELDE